MNIKNQPPVFIPIEHRADLEKLSKAALMDLAWDLATTSSGADGDARIMEHLRERIDIILTHRRQA